MTDTETGGTELRAGERLAAGRVLRWLPFTKRFCVAAAAFAALLVLYALLRLGFYLVNLEFFEGTAAPDIALAFMRGLRFDTAALLMINAPLLVLYVTPGFPHRRGWYRALLFGLFAAVNLTAVALNIADYSYYPTVQRRMMFEPYTAVRDLARMLPAVIRAYWIEALAFAAVVAGFFWFGTRLFRRLERAIPERNGVVPSIVSVIVLALAMIIGIRGGLQLKPIRQADAFRSSNTSLGYLTLNTTYTVMRSYFQPLLPEYRFYARDEAASAVRGMLQREGETCADVEWPFLRLASPEGEPQRRNVVILIMESWTVNGDSSGRSATPFFDSLKTQGWYFSSILANGQRSIEAVPSILASVPGLYAASLIGSQAELDRFRGLGDILLENGYGTVFLHGAATGSMGFDAFARLAGFRDYVGKEDYPSPADSLFDGIWGLNDEPFFLDAARRLGSYRQPFCATLFSLSSHVPFEVPRHRASLVAGIPEREAFSRSLRYSDFALSQFFQAARRMPWFANTIFIITGDHTLFSERHNFLSTFHVPLLFYAPGIIPPRVTERIGQHADLLPTVLDLLHLPAVHASMGRSLLDTAAERFAVLRFGDQYAIVADSLLYLSDLETNNGLYAYRRDPQLTNDLASRRPDETQRLRRRLLSYVQCATTALAKDRIYDAQRARALMRRHR
jgi:phosphoglycerol transferase MdoB-like AlkP superfamily enzyme